MTTTAHPETSAVLPASGDRPRIVFVDDEPHLLAGLRRMLRQRRADWDMVFADGAQEALEHLARGPVDVLVSDMRMPGMNGAQLLAAVQQRSPSTVRIILSGQSDRDSVLSAVRHAQQFLAKPCDEATLTTAVDRALEVRRRLADPVVRELLGGVVSVPVLPSVYHDLVRATDDPGEDLAQVAAVLASDVAASAEVLKLVNSAFFGLPREVSTVVTAVSLLGLDNIRALVLAGALFQADDGGSGLDVEELRETALRRMAVGRRIARHEGWEQEQVNHAGLSCMLRDLGLLVLARGMPERARMLSADDDQAVHELAAFGCTVPQASAHLLGLWGFLPVVVCAVAAQPLAPAAGPTGPPLAEHVLDFAHRRVSGDRADPGYLDRERLAEWNRIADETDEEWPGR